MEINRTKLIEKKVYGMLIESSKTLYLSVQSAYSLEEAFYLAKLEFEKISPKQRGVNDILDAKIGLFSMKTFVELENSPDIKIAPTGDLQTLKRNPIEEELDEMEKIMGSFGNNDFDRGRKKRTLPIQATTPPDLKDFEVKPEQEKNELMSKIIKTNDRELFLINIGKFTADEVKYIEERLK